MILHEQFIRMAKRNPERMAIIDRTLDKRVTYSKALIGAIILSKKFRKYDPGFVGVMVPTSAGCALATLGVLMSGRIPVMINYSTGAESNAKYAQQKCGFKTIITSKALLEKVGCPKSEGMVFMEDIMAGVGTGDKIKAALLSKLPASAIINMTYKGGEDVTNTFFDLFVWDA